MLSIQNFLYVAVVAAVTSYSGTNDLVTGDPKEVQLTNEIPLTWYQVKTVDGIGQFYIDQRIDIIKNLLREGKVWEPEIVSLIGRFVKPDSVAVDIGAHIGTHTLTMARAASKVEVVAFEPQKKLFSELVANMRLNRQKNVTLYRAAVGESSGEVEMNPAVIDNEGGTKIGKGGDKAPLITLDSLKLKNVSFMKIDVENGEFAVLKGAEKTIEESRPVMVIEILGNHYDQILDRDKSFEEIVSWLKEKKYSVSYIPGSWSDYLALPY